jgi:hypothetical protein
MDAIALMLGYLIGTASAISSAGSVRGLRAKV